MKRTPAWRRAELNIAKRRWTGVAAEKLAELQKLVEMYYFSVALGDISYINNNWYITHAGLLRLANRKRCSGIKTILEKRYSDPLAGRWIFRATVYKSRDSKGFVGYGDADSSNVSPLVRGAEMRVAETRAVNRALRKAYGIGLCSVEELGWEPKTYNEPHRAAPTPNSNGHQNGHASLRDRLCLLIRQHQLDASLVKAYAADFCGTPNLRDATREQIETFIANLSDWATKDRQALLCKLNSYSRPQEPTS